MAQQGLSEGSLLGQTLGHYRIVDLIGEGGMGVVYRAYDEHLCCDVAIKVLLPGSVNDESARKPFRKEARILSRLNHPNIAIVHDFDTDHGVDYLVMEYVPGVTLGEKLASSKPSQKDAITLGIELADGLSAAHERGVIHSDLKPGNLRLTEDGRLKILDFGLARLQLALTPMATTASLQDAGMLGGTLPYMAPDQLQGGNIDARTDTHAAGCVLYEMATGRHPFAEVGRSQLIGAILRKPPLQPTALNPEVSPELERIISKCLEKEPANRYQSAKELAIDLRQLLAGGTAISWVPARRVVSVLWKWVGVAVTMLALVIATLDVYRRSEEILPGGGPQRILSLAVLPVKNFSGDPAQDFFADGMTDALIADLAQIKAIKVIPRTSVMHYKGTSQTVPEIAKELGVDGIVEASVVRSGSRVRLTAQLIDARRDRHLWAGRYEREMADVLVLQSEFVEAIASEIRQLTPQQSERLTVARRVDPEVYDNTLKGRPVIEYATREEDIRQAIELFQKAVARDPSYALAWAGLAESTWTLAMVGFEFVAPAEVRDKAIAAAERALQLDPGLADAHKARAVIAYDGEWNPESAQQHFERALQLRSSYAAAHNLYGQMLAGQPLQAFDEAHRHLDRARELDPLSPLGDGGKAAPKFKKFIDHPGMLANCPLAALARLGVARANALQATPPAQMPTPPASARWRRTKTSSSSGRTPTQRFRSISKPKRSTRSCSTLVAIYKPGSDLAISVDASRPMRK